MVELKMRDVGGRDGRGRGQKRSPPLFPTPGNLTALLFPRLVELFPVSSNVPANLALACCCLLQQSFGHVPSTNVVRAAPVSTEVEKDHLNLEAKNSTDASM